MRYPVLLPKLVLSVLLWSFACLSPLFLSQVVASESAEDCQVHILDSPKAADDIAAYRDNYQPREFFHEAAFWQWLDFIVLLTLLIVAAVLIYGRKGKQAVAFTVLAGVTLFYFGFVRAGCICPVGAVANITQGIRDPELVGRGVALLFLIPIVAAFFFGRIFCSAGCPLGAIQSLVSGNKPYHLPPVINRIVQIGPGLILAATVFLVLRNACLLVCILDPYHVIFALGHGWMDKLMSMVTNSSSEAGVVWLGDLTTWIATLGVLVIGYYVRRPFCRLICPYGVILGVFSLVSIKRRAIDPSICRHCSRCAHSCPTQAIVIDQKEKIAKLSNYACIQCNKCADICSKDAI